jgi:hypothetical protein
MVSIVSSFLVLMILLQSWSSPNTVKLAKETIDEALDEYQGIMFYHWTGENMHGSDTIMWMDDVFYMSTGQYDFRVFDEAVLDTFSLARSHPNFTHTPPRLDVREMDSVIDRRPYSALYYNIMVYWWTKWAVEEKGKDYAISRAHDWKDVVLQNHNYIKSNYIKDDIFYVKGKSNLQPDYVRKRGYCAYESILYLASLRSIQYVYGIDTEEDFNASQKSLVRILWREDHGFFADWVDQDGKDHLHYETEQLWGIVLDVIPPSYQFRLYSSLDPSRERFGRFWQYEEHSLEEMAEEASQYEIWWDEWYKICEAMIYVKALRKFNHGYLDEKELLEPFEEAISENKFFPDIYEWRDGKMEQSGYRESYIMNAGPWLSIKYRLDLSIKPLDNGYEWHIIGLTLALLTAYILHFFTKIILM